MYLFKSRLITLLALSLFFICFSLLSLFIIDAPQSVQAAPAWTSASTVSDGVPQSIGGYASGCLQGGSLLPQQGSGYESIRRYRNRYYAHPATIHLLEDLGREVERAGLLPMEIGDLSQPRGGRMKYGHRSHQSGLDADIWFGGDPAYREGEGRQRKRRVKRKAKSKRWSAKTLRRALFDVDHPSAVKGWRETLDKKVWSTRHEQLLKRAANRPEVARIFVHFRIKEKMCEVYRSESKARDDTARDDTAREVAEEQTLWLRKLRPWYGHHQHFHIRLHCPPGSPECDNQGPLPKGLGCEGLEWFSKREKKERKRAAKKEEDKEIARRATLSARELKALKVAEAKEKRVRSAAAVERQELLMRRCRHLGPSR